MTHVGVTVPESLLAALRKAPHEMADEMRLAAAIHWYQLLQGLSGLNMKLEQAELHEQFADRYRSVDSLEADSQALLGSGRSLPGTLRT